MVIGVENLQSSSLVVYETKVPNVNYVDSIGLLFHVIVITQRNSILKNYNNLQDHQTQTNKHIITKRVLDYYPSRHGISKTLIPSFFDPRMSSQRDPSTADSTPPVFSVIHLLKE